MEDKTLFYPGMSSDIFAPIRIYPNITTIYVVDKLVPRNDGGYFDTFEELKMNLFAQIVHKTPYHSSGRFKFGKYYDIEPVLPNFDASEHVYGFNIDDSSDIGDSHDEQMRRFEYTFRLKFTYGLMDINEQINKVYKLVYYYGYDFYKPWPKEIQNVDIFYGYGTFGTQWSKDLLNRLLSISRPDSDLWIIASSSVLDEFRKFTNIMYDPFPRFIGMGSENTTMYLVQQGKDIIEQALSHKREKKKIRLLECQFCGVMTTMICPEIKLPFCNKKCRKHWRRKQEIIKE